MRRSVAALAAISTAFTLSACGGASGDDPRTVTVIGTGEIKAAPDALKAELGVSTNAADVTTATDQANARAKAIIDAVLGQGVDKADVQTSQFNVSPDFTGPNNTPNGYRVTNMVTVTVRDLEKASKVLDEAIKAGGNDTRMNSVQFVLDNDSDAVKQAREKAFDDAKSRAQQYADLSDSGLGDVVTINEATTTPGQPPVTFSDTAEKASVPLEPGTETVTFQVQVKFALS